MAEDVARIIPALIEKGGVYNVCDTRQPSFGELSISVAKQLGKRKPVSIPYWVAWCMAKWVTCLDLKLQSIAIN